MDTHSVLGESLTLTKGYKQPKDAYFLRAESFYNMATSIERDYSSPNMGDLNQYYGGKSLHEQSHGESFMALMQNRFWGSGVYILDEPEAALSPQRQMAMLILINEQIKKGSQFFYSNTFANNYGIPTGRYLEF